MRSFVTIDRVILVLLVLALGNSYLAHRRTMVELTRIRNHQEQLAAAVGALQTTQQNLAKVALKATTGTDNPVASMLPAPVAPAAPPALAPAATAGSRVRGPARAARAEGRRTRLSRMKTTSGAEIITRMYDGADRMAEDKRWDEATYERVTGVFEASFDVFREVQEDMMSGAMTPAQAKREVISERQVAIDSLTDILGEDGLRELALSIRNTE